MRLNNAGREGCLSSAELDLHFAWIEKLLIYAGWRYSLYLAGNW